MKKTARLSGSLLARKGFASPAAAVPMFGKAHHYGQMPHHHIRDVVYDHVDPEQVDLDPQPSEEPVQENGHAESYPVEASTENGAENGNGSSGNFVKRVQESLKSLSWPNDQSESAEPENATESPKTTKPKRPSNEDWRSACCQGNPSTKRVAMTLRLDHARHLRLRVLSAHVNRSSQDILTEALDDYLDRFAHMPEMKQCDCLRAEMDDS